MINKTVLAALCFSLVAGFSFASEANINGVSTPVNESAQSLTGITRGRGCTPEGDYIQWQCGGRPSGSGWVRVSRDCYHKSLGHCAR